MEYYGVGPGIKILIDSNYEIAQFTSINKEILKKAGQYETIDADEAVKKIISTQATTAQRLDAADDVIENVGTFEMLKASVLKLHAMYLSLSRKS